MTMKKQILIAVALTSFIFLSGCATPVQRIAQTPSGRPEMLINSNDADLVKTSIINEMQSSNYFLQNDSQYRLVFTKQIEGSRAFWAQMLIGSQYRTPPTQVVVFNFTKQGENIKVMGYISMTTQSAFGQVRNADMKDDNAWFNEQYSMLQRAKDTIEKDNKSVAVSQNKPANKESGVYSIEVRP